MRVENCHTDDSQHGSTLKTRSRAPHKLVLLAQLVQLRIPVEHPRGDELVENAEDKRRQHRKDDVVKREGPTLLEDLPRERVREGELFQGAGMGQPSDRAWDRGLLHLPRSRSCTARCSCRSCSHGSPFEACWSAWAGPRAPEKKSLTSTGSACSGAGKTTCRARATAF